MHVSPVLFLPKTPHPNMRDRLAQNEGYSRKLVASDIPMS
jgi:hypothetical protein